jgi:hypothetical protein
MKAPVFIKHPETDGGLLATSQFYYEDEGGNYWYQSYDSVIAMKEPSGKVRLSERWDYSRTTIKYLRRFLDGESLDSIRLNVKHGVYKIELDT